MAYGHISQGKLNPRSRKGIFLGYIFLGYPDGVKGYRVWLVDEEKDSDQ